MTFTPNWTILFLLFAVVVFLFQITEVFDWRYFAFTPAFAFDMPWTFITSMFLHGDLTHLFFNSFALLMFGMPLENRIGSSRYLGIFFVSGIAGSLGYFVTASNPLIPAVGMSGAIFGIMGALAMMMPTAMVFVGGFVPMPMIVAVFFWAISEFLGLFVPSGIAHGAHIGGLIVGVLVGIYLKRQEDKHTKRYKRINLRGYADWER